MQDLSLLTWKEIREIDKMKTTRDTAYAIIDSVCCMGF